jgi:CTP:molybdopterin cytidylyltransferase MocA
VDTVGVSEHTLRQVLEQARRILPAALRPTYQGQPGRLIWIGRQTAEQLLALPSTDLRLDRHLAEKTVTTEIDDPAILSNVNTPEDWEKALRP